MKPRTWLLCLVFLPIIYFEILLFSSFDTPREPPSLQTFHHCTNGRSMELWRVTNNKPDISASNYNFDEMQCYFENLLLTENRRFVYVHPDPPPDYLREFFHLRGLQFAHREIGVFTSVESRPTAVVFSTCRARGFPNGANTPGHDFDYIFTAWRSLLDFGFDENSDVFVHAVSRRRCPTLQSKFWATLAKRTGFTEDLFNIPERTVFRRFVIARKKTKELPMLPPDTSIIKAYVDHALKSLEIDTKPPCQIGIHLKQSGHRFLNFVDVQKYLSKSENCGLRAIGNWENMTAKQEIQQIRDLKIYLTPAGGGSFSAIFMQEGTQLFLGKICWPVSLRNGDLNHVSVLEKAVDFSCRRSDNLLWDSIFWIQIHFVGPQRVSDFIMERDWVKDGPWSQTLNAFGYSYNLSLPLLNQVMQLIPLKKQIILNVGGYMKTGSGMVSKGIQSDYISSTAIKAQVPQSEGFYLLKSLPNVNMFLTCLQPPDYLPSVGKFACKWDGPCRAEVQQNFIDDIGPYIDKTKKYIVQKTPTISFVEMEVCFRPNIMHFFTLRHPWFWSQTYYLNDFKREAAGRSEQMYSILKMMQTIRMILTVKPVSPERFFFVNYEKEITNRRRLELEDDGNFNESRLFEPKKLQSWILCTRNVTCQKCLGISQRFFGIFGYNLLNPWGPLNKNGLEKKRAFDLIDSLPTFISAESDFTKMC